MGIAVAITCKIGFDNDENSFLLLISFCSARFVLRRVFQLSGRVTCIVERSIEAKDGFCMSSCSNMQ